MVVAGRSVDVDLALGQEAVRSLAATKASERGPKDKRNLYLVRRGQGREWEKGVSLGIRMLLAMLGVVLGGVVAGCASCRGGLSELLLPLVKCGVQAKEGTIAEGSPAWEEMSIQDRNKRKRAASECCRDWAGLPPLQWQMLC